MAVDLKKKQDLLAKFGKNTEFAVATIEDDSSGDETDGGTQVKILHLVSPVNAVGSIPTPDGNDMKVSGKKVYVAQDDIDRFFDQVEEKDGILLYKGPMHLDVSKPGTRNVNGSIVITKPAKIWLTSTKFSRRGGQLRQAQSNGLNTFINGMFAGGKVVDLASESNTVSAGATGTPTTGTGTEKPPVEVVANQ